MVAIQNENTELRSSVRTLEANQNSLQSDVQALKLALESRSEIRSPTRSAGTSGYSTLEHRVASTGSTLDRNQQDLFVKDLQAKLSLRLSQ